MKILVTGANGFIGSNLISKLQLEDNNIIYALKKNATPSLNENIRLIDCDLSTENFVSALPEKVDIVVHLAQSNQYRNFPDGTEDIFAVNIRSTQLLLEWSRKIGVKKFIFASSGNVYKQQEKLLNETDACEPLDYYGATKYAGEQLIKPYSKFFEIVILRLFSVYGPGQKKMTIPNIIEKIKKKEEITLANGKGLFFSPLYINDCTNALLKIIYNKQNAQIINFAGSETVDLGTVVETISKILNIDPVLKITNALPMFLTGSNIKMINEIIYAPKVRIEEGITSMLNTYT